MNATVHLHHIASATVKTQILESGTEVTIISLKDENGDISDIAIFSKCGLHITQLKPEVK